MLKKSELALALNERSSNQLIDSCLFIRGRDMASALNFLIESNTAGSQ